MEHFLTTDILLIISEFLDNVKDYIHLFQINKFVYKNTLLNNNETAVLQNELFKKETIYFNEKLPSYLFQLKYLNTSQENENNNLLHKFNNLKYLKIQNVPENFIFPNLPFLEELIIRKSTLHQNTLINLQQQLKIIDIHCCKLNDNCLSYLNNLQELNLICDKISGECLQNFKNLIKLNAHFSIDYNDDFTKYVKNLTNLKHLTIRYSEPINNSNFLKKLTNLEYLSVILEDIYEEDFKNLTKIKILNISGNILSENCFTNLVNLIELNVNNSTNFTGKCLLNLTNLERLKVMDTNVKDEYFKNLKKLKQVNLSYCNEITVLCVRKCENLTGKCFEYLVNLKSLYIFRNNSIKEENLEKLVNLNDLSFFKCPQLLKKGNYLLNMNKLKTIDFKKEIGSRKIINEVKEKIRNGESLEQISLMY
ncbi:hypothetical protein ABK040_015345 [Willaertia magna]